MTTPCNPLKPLPTCPTCARYSPQLPHLAECRPLTVCIDATVTTKGGICTLHKAKPMPVLWYAEEAFA
jgi:hypothetical protein